MQHEAVRIGIRQMTAEIAAERTKLITSPIEIGPGKPTAELDRLAGRIERWRAQLLLWQRQIKSAASLNDLILDKAGRGPAARPARDSHRGKAQALDGLRDAALGAAREIDGLIRDIFRSPGPEAAALNAMSDALDSLMQAREAMPVTLDLRGLPEGQAVISAMTKVSPSPQPVFPPTGPVDLFTLILGYFVLLHALGKRPGR
jgi:hypothetical protein